MSSVPVLKLTRVRNLGTIDTDGNLETESEALRNVSKEYIDDGIPVLVLTIYENEDEETVYADGEVMVKPGTERFVQAFVDEFPSPFDYDPSALRRLPCINESGE